MKDRSFNVFAVIFPLLLLCSGFTSVLSLNQSSSRTSSRSNFKKTGEVKRRGFLSALSPCAITGVCAIVVQPKPSNADLTSAASSGLPMVGRFEQLKGANAIIGNWDYEATKGIKQGRLVFLKNGEVELRSTDDLSTVVAVGAVPWKYISPKGTDTLVTVTFTLDEDNEEDVLIFQGLFDAAAGPSRIMEGSIATGRAEIGARGSGPMKRIGSFKATFVQ